MTKRKSKWTPIHLKGTPSRAGDNPKLDVISVQLTPLIDLMLEGGARYRVFPCVQDCLEDNKC